ncbi:SDR family oxidoreductase [Filimonas effusa]|uniref:Aldehyde reductase n=1 Tax=Filimonas effusa TaxID=2508721 RepID=A0A4Q1D8Z0_9BACT|nr:aldehyde reductase [Filimonas effusa]RXK85680.1 aldehyde reductase [Filimonas effusa]
MTTQNKDTQVLVTGGSGFVGSHCILQLLAQGYRVKTTIRNLSKAGAVRDMLREGGATAPDALAFAEADLMNDKGWNEAVAGCDYVLHVASPFPATVPADEDELIIPATRGTLSVLRAARDAGVKRVVVTSSFAAVGYSIDAEDHVFTEDDWTNPNANIAPYIKSKTLAERAAWNFIRQEGGSTALTVINPVGIFGPVLGKDYSTSIQMVQALMSGKMPGTPNLSFGVVDVRDVADLHIKAMLHPDAKDQRFLAVADGGEMTFPEIGSILHEYSASLAKKVPLNVLPNWVVKLASLFKPELKQMVPFLGKKKLISNNKAKTCLGWQPRSKKEMIIDTAESLIKFNLV